MTRILFFFAVLGLIGTNLYSEEWSETQLELLYGSGFKLGDTQRETFTFEHSSGWKYGDNHFFFDAQEPMSKSITLYGEFDPSLSFSKITGLNLETGILKDVIATGNIEMETNYRAYLIGAGVDLKIPAFDFFRVKLLSRNNPDASGSTFQVTFVWNLHVKVGKSKIIFRGFADLSGMEGTLYGSQITQPELLLDLGGFWNAPDTLSVGIEYAFYGNKYGVKGVNESVMQPMICWTF